MIHRAAPDGHSALSDELPANPSEASRHVLIFSLHFDSVDAGSEVVGSVRPQLLARYLPAEGWLPIIVTGAAKSATRRTGDLVVRYVPTSWPIADLKTRSGISNAELHHARRSRTSDPSLLGRVRTTSRRFAVEAGAFVPDSLAWAVRASRVGIDVVRRSRPDAIYSTSPSPAAHLAAWLVASSTGIPWIAEFRDLTPEGAERLGTRARRIPDAMFEGLILRRAACLVTVSEPLAVRLRQSHRRIPVHAVETGFDPRIVAPPNAELDRDFRLVYAGRISERQDLQRILSPLAVAISSGRIDRTRTRVDLMTMGTLSDADRAFIREQGLEGVVVEHSQLPRDDVMRRERAAQILLHLRWDDPSEKGILTGKVFEYLAARRPILSTGRYDDGVTTLLVETGAGVATTSNDETAAWLIDAFASFRATGRVPYFGEPSVIGRYDARRTASTIASLLDEAVTHDGRPT